MWVHNDECCGLIVGEINPQTGHRVLASTSSSGDYIVEATKPSTKGKLVKTKN